MARYNPPQHPDDSRKREEQAQRIAAIGQQISTPLRALHDQFVGLVKEIKSNNEETDRKVEERSNKHLTWMKRTAISSGIFSFFSLVVACVTLYMLNNQLVMMRLDQRAWVGVGKVIKPPIIRIKGQNLLRHKLSLDLTRIYEIARGFCLIVLSEGEHRIKGQNLLRHGLSLDLTRAYKIARGFCLIVHRIGVQVTNSGKTPARKLATRLRTHWAPKGSIFTPDFSPGRERETTLHPGMSIDVADLIQFPYSTLSLMKAGAIVLYFYGTISYWDIFKCKHTETFCTYLGEGLSTLKNCLAYNEPEEEICHGQESKNERPLTLQPEE